MLVVAVVIVVAVAIVFAVVVNAVVAAVVNVVFGAAAVVAVLHLYVVLEIPDGCDKGFILR